MMYNPSVPAPSIVVAGDPGLDWLVATRKPQGGPLEASRRKSGEAWARLCCRPGGVYLLAKVIRATLKAEAEIVPGPAGEASVLSLPSPRPPFSPSDRRLSHLYAACAMFGAGRGQAAPASGAVWRAAEYLGFDPAAPEAASSPDGWNQVEGDDPDAALVVLDDGNRGFRDSQALWPRALQPGAGKTPWIILRAVKPFGRGRLWEHLLASHRERLVVIVAADDLRQSEVQISRGVSWERTAQDLVWELTYSPQVNAVSRCAMAVVSFDTTGAVLMDNRAASKAPPAGGAGGARRTSWTLFFDPRFHEGEWTARQPGFMIGYTYCLVAAFTRARLTPQEGDEPEAIVRGLSAMRTLHNSGFRPEPQGEEELDLSFPFQAVAANLTRGPKAPFASVPIPCPRRAQEAETGQRASEPAAWTILAAQHPGALDDVARRIVLHGLEKTLTGVPVGRFGAMTTVVRAEIEGYHNVANLLREYVQQSRQRRPLSVAVFGSPGSGKSFAIKQLAKALLGDRLAVLEFNLSQLSGPGDLLQAFHRIQDSGLGGAMPLVFWDEFDSNLGAQPLGWLRYFLAPMQDGTFQDGPIAHPLGPCLFVFAGGTSRTFDEFARSRDQAEFIPAKGPDFVSRLRGYVNILGPDPVDLKASADPYSLIRRAVLLRSVLEREASLVLDTKGTARVDPGVLRGLLHTASFRHGARSLEAVVTMSALAGKTYFDRSSLPSEDQLEIHVQSADFLALVRRIDLGGELLETLAAYVHETYCEDLRREGFIPGKATDRETKPPTHSALRPYAELGDDEKEQNRDFLRSIWDKLQDIGYVMRPAAGAPPRFKFAPEDLEALAQAEHDRWWQLKRAQGWRWGEKTDKATKIHADMKSYAELREDVKEQDRQKVRIIPSTLARAGYQIAKVNGSR